jgi:dTDP-4-dehydrorhamnose reductase
MEKRFKRGTPTMKSLILGARGLVGSAISKQIPDAILGNPVEPKRGTRQVYADLTKYESLFKVFSNHRPDVVYLPASIAHVDRCEESLGTDVTNVRGAITVLRLCESFGAKLVYFSSSYVFNGEKKEPYTTQDETCPLNRYGIQKEIVEKTILKSDAKFIIVRTVGVYGTERLKKNFAKQVISALFSGQKVYAPSDQFMNPILSNDLARITIKLADKYNGLFHVAGDTCLSKFEFAQRIARYFNMEKLVEPKTSDEMHQTARRPKNGCLYCGGLGELGIEVPSFQGGLANFMSMNYNEDDLARHIKENK